jgi:tRNA threonylcarbamoyladenosine biosynthesis protein TsaB
LETSGRIGGVALAQGPVVVGRRQLSESRRHAQDLAPAVADLLREQGWRARDLQAVVVSRGPGSYTGLRVGIMSAKTLAYATGAALVAVETFAVIALQAPAEATPLDVIADAQRDLVYVQRFVRSQPSQGVMAATPLSIQRVTDWIASQETAVWTTGPGLGRYRDRLPPEKPLVISRLWDPQPEALLQIGLKRFLTGERDDPWALEPLYLRPSSAEEKWTAHRPPG